MKFIRKIKEMFELAKADFELRRAIIEADRKSKATGLRYYVLPNYEHRLFSASYRELKRMRQLGMFSNKATIVDFTRECFYFTSSNYEPEINPSLKKKKRNIWLKYVCVYRLKK